MMKTRVYILFYIIFMLSVIASNIFGQKASAEYISSLDPPHLLSGQNVRDGVQHLTYYNNTLYVIDIWAGIQIVDVSDISKPKEIGRFQNDHRARNFFIQGDYGYLADELEGVHILDMKNPRKLSQIGKIETIGDAWWVEANYPYVYVAEEKSGVQAYDISDLNAPKPLGKFDTPGWAWGLTVKGDIVFIADKSGGLQIVDFTDKNNPVRIGQFQEPSQAKSIHIEDNYLFLTDGPNGLFILDISNPKFPNLVSKINTDGFVFDVFKGGKYLYVANESKSRLEIINLTDITKPTMEASYQADDKIFGVWKEDVYVFVAANNKTLVLRHNSPPVLADIEAQSVNEMQTLTITPQGYDPDGDKVHFEISKLPEGAKFDSLSGIISWTPTYEQSGIYDNIKLKIVEHTASQLFTEKSFSITVNHVNRPPSIPEIENFAVDENLALKFTIKEGVDPDIEDKGRLIYLAENLPAGASFDSLKRTFAWTPTFEQSGTYVVDFIVKDPAGAQARDASTLTVAHIDRKPTIDLVADNTIPENQTLTFVISGKDPDKEDQNAISFQAENLPEGARFDKNSHSFTWIPSYEQSGQYQNIRFIMQAGKLSDTTLTSITVTHASRAPVLAKIENKSVDEEKTLSFTISGQDLDKEDQGNLVFSATNLPSGATFNPDSLKFTWKPGFEQSGDYSNITFTITDGAGLSDSKSIDINVRHVNRTPILQEISPAAGDENSEISFMITGNDPDKEDAGSIKYTVDGLPKGAIFENNKFLWTPSYEQAGKYEISFAVSDGKLTDKKTTTLTINHVNRPPAIEPIPAQTVDENKKLELKVVGSDPDAEDSGLWKLSAATLPEGAVFDAAMGTLTWTPNFDQAGSYKINFINTDQAGLNAVMDLEITVNHVNRTPVLNPIAAQSTDENVPVKITIEPAVDPDVEDKDKLVYSVQNLPDGASFDATTRTLSWTPTFDQSGVYEIPVTVTDGNFSVTQPLSLTINHINRAPAITDPRTVTGDENQALKKQIEFTDPDKEDEGKIKLTIDNLPTGAAFDAATSTLTWTPTFDQAGNYTDIKVTATDPAGLAANAVFSIQINNVNRVPEFKLVQNLSTNENQGIDATFEATDPDKEDAGKLQYSSDNLPDGATLDAANGKFSWVPGFTQAGEYSISMSATDPGGLTARTDANITVVNVNRRPAIQSIGNQTVNENESIQIQLTGSDEDSDNSLQYTAEGLPSGASIDNSTGLISWTPGFDQAGTYNITAQISDGEANAQTSFSITVNNVNRAPVITGGGSATVLPGEAAEIKFGGSDEDGDKLTFESNDLPSGATLDASSGQFRWTPGENQVGSYNFTVRVSDGKESDQASGSVTVQQPPQNTETNEQ